MTLEHDILNTKTARTPEEAKRLFEIKPIVKILERRNNLNENIDMLKKQKEDDEHTKKQIENEIKGYADRMTAVDRELQTILLEPQYTEGGVLLEVVADAKKQQAMLFAQELFEMYKRYAEYKDWETCVVSQEQSVGGGIRKASMFIEGVGVPELMKMEAGMHRVVKTCETENEGNVDISSVLVSVVPKPAEKEDIPTKDIEIENTNSDSAKDQESKDGAVRITHKPSGTVVECKDSQTQAKNEEIAIQKMKTLLLLMLEKQSKASQPGSSVEDVHIRTYSYPKNRVTEHRKGGITHNNLEDFMMGEYPLEHMQESLLIENKRQEFMNEVDQFAQEVKMKSADNI
uniref:Peptide chain release factor domain-containing protein n=1 Tax=Heliothis virescens TaxID=7102 RepID=A0A2A4JUC4_HELVI